MATPETPGGQARAFHKPAINDRYFLIIKLIGMIPFTAMEFANNRPLA
jgi:hypothetical protein